MSRFGYVKVVGCFIALLLVGTISGRVYADGPPPEVPRVAEEGLARFLDTIPARELARMGLASAEDVQAATLAIPYEQFTLTSDALSTYESGTSLSSVLTSTDTWLFPVMVHKEARTMLTVAIVTGQWEAGEIGGTYLPAALQAAEARLPALLQQKGVTSAYATRFVRVFQVYADFLAVETEDADYLLPLMPDPSRLRLEADTLATPDQVLPQLNTLVGHDLEGKTLGGEAAAVSETGGPADLLSVEQGEAEIAGAPEVVAETGDAANEAPVEGEADTSEGPGTSSLLLYGGAFMLALIVLGGALLVVMIRKIRA